MMRYNKKGQVYGAFTMMGLGLFMILVRGAFALIPDVESRLPVGVSANFVRDVVNVIGMFSIVAAVFLSLYLTLSGIARVGNRMEDNSRDIRDLEVQVTDIQGIIRKVLEQERKKPGGRPGEAS